MRRNRETWKKLVSDYRASGNTAEAFAMKHRLNVGTLRWWSRQWPKEARTNTLVPVQFVPVRSKAAAAPDLIEAQIGAISLRFQSGTDVDYLTALLQGLGRTC